MRGGAKNKRSFGQLTSWAVEEEVRKCEKGRGGNTSLWIWTVKRGGGNPQICNSLFAEHFVLTRYRLICELFGDFVFLWVMLLQGEDTCCSNICTPNQIGCLTI